MTGEILVGQPTVDTQPAAKRTRNFSEVALGYPKRIAAEEAKRCPQCADPVCRSGCPLGINIPGFIRMIREGNVSGALTTIKEQNPLPSVCGRICVAPCEAACVLTDEAAPIGIRALERFASDNAQAKAAKPAVVASGARKVAVIGSGPAGLSAARQLMLCGMAVTVFEALDKPGGILRYGIPEFRLPAKVLDTEIQEMRSSGIHFEFNTIVGKTKSYEDLLKEGFSAVVLALGAGVPKFMDLPGANLGGVYYGEEFLMRLNLMRLGFLNKATPSFFIGKNVTVIGSGNTALDCARAAKRFGRDVRMIFRRTEAEMRVKDDVLKYAKEEGINLEPYTKPVALMPGPNNYVCGIKCVKMDFASLDNQNWRLMPVPESEFVIDSDTVIIAIGHNPNNSYSSIQKSLKAKSDGTLWVDAKSGQTSVEGIFAVGNIVTNAGPVVEAIASGKRVAEGVLKYINKS